MALLALSPCLPAQEAGPHAEEQQTPVVAEAAPALPKERACILATAMISQMLNRFRQTAPTVALLICVAFLLATWLTGAHGHRHVGGHEHEPGVSGWSGAHSEHGHLHERAPAQSDADGLATMVQFDGEHFTPHPDALIHADGHENIEVQALQPPAGRSPLDLPLLVQFFCVAFVLARARAFIVLPITDPPDSKRADGSLRPPLRGPPLALRRLI